MRVEDIDSYIQAQREEVRPLLQELRAVIRAAAPEATERMAYAIPTFFLNGNLVHFAAFANHIGLYPGPEGIVAFAEELGRYKSAKGSVQFPLSEPLPLDLVRRIVEFRAVQNREKKPKRAPTPKT